MVLPVRILKFYRNWRVQVQEGTHNLKLVKQSECHQIKSPKKLPVLSLFLVK